MTSATDANNQALNGWTLPLAWVQAGPDTSHTGWWLSPNVTSLSLVSEDNTTSPLVLPHGPTIGTVVAGSSAAFGMLGSPDWLQERATHSDRATKQPRCGRRV